MTSCRHPFAAAVIVVLAGCTDPLGPHDRPPANVTLQPACSAARGTIHRGNELDGHRFRRPGSPHWVMETLLVREGTATIEPGTTVCFAAGAQLQIADSGRVEAIGTRVAPVLLTAMDPGQPWGGIRRGGEPGPLGGHIILVNATLEHALQGIAVNSYVLDSTVIRQIRGAAVRGFVNFYTYGFTYSLGNGRITNSRMDTTCVACGDSVAAIAVTQHRLVIERTVIRGSGGHGIHVGAGTLSLYDVLIEGSASTGLIMSSWSSPRQLSPGQPRFATPPVSVRITQGSSYPAYLPTALISELLPDAAAEDRLMGNAHDALRVWGGLQGEAVIRGRLPWLLADLAAHSFTGHLRLEPGAVLHSERTALLDVSSGGRITAEGTPERPITLSGLDVRLSGQPAAPSRIAHARLESVRLNASGSHGVVLEDVVGTNSRLIVGAPGSQVRRARFDGSFTSPGTLLVDSATVVMHAPDVLVSAVAVRRAARHGFLINGANARLSGCEASGNGGAGVRVTGATGVRIVACDFFDNAGPGVLNTAAVTVDGRGNWWGSPAGPTGTNGDGVAGVVDYLPYLDAPAAGAGTLAPISALSSTTRIQTKPLRALHLRP